MTDEQPQPADQGRMTVGKDLRILTLEKIVGRNAIQQALMQSGLEQLTGELVEASQQRDIFQARATELAKERDVLQERLTEYESDDAEVTELETPKSDDEIK